jgi:hypothetical protein
MSTCWMTERTRHGCGLKEGHRPMGVYRVLSRVNGTALIGASLDLPATLNRYPFQLEAGSHTNRRLHADVHTRGAETFDFEVLDVLQPADRSDYNPTKDLQALEQMWLEKLFPFGKSGYNPPPEKVSSLASRLFGDL